MSSGLTRRLAVTVVAAGAVVGLAAPSFGDTTRIKAIKKNDRYLWNKDFVTISKGDKVVWKNPTNVDHTVTFYQGASKNTRIDEGERTSKKFRKRGAFLYRCTIHSQLNDGECSGMCGHVHVS